MSRMLPPRSSRSRAPRAVVAATLLGTALAGALGAGTPIADAAPAPSAAPTAAPAAPAAPAGKAAARAGIRIVPLHFKVKVGPQRTQVCDIVGDLYLPRTASSRRRVPAVLTTNGFGGSKNDQADAGRALAARGYAVLSYSGLGFGGSSCAITLDDPQFDGLAASQLVSFLGGARGIAFRDAAHTQPVPPLTVVQRDRRDHRGTARANDPRVGTYGFSYGGGFQFALASVDSRVDALIPFITWNDLSYSLAPNNTAQTSGVTSSTPGVTKLLWAAGFSGLGVAADLRNNQVPDLPCPNFATFVCPALITAGTTGYLQPGDRAALRRASVATYMSKVRVPTLLIQGQRDTLFNLNEATATYRALRRQGTPTRMVWYQGGHSGPAAKGEFDWTKPTSTYLPSRVLAWFDHYLKGRKVNVGPRFAYFRDWVRYSGNARKAYATSATFPVGSTRTWRLSGTNALTTGTAKAGTQSLLVPGAGLPTRLDEFDVLGSFVGPVPSIVSDLPGTAASWSTAPLSAPLRVAGAPTVRLKVQAPAAAGQAAGPAGQLVLFVKVADVGPDGKARLINGLEAPVRVPDATKPFTVRLPAIVHQFARGHRLQLVVAGGSINYRGGILPGPVTIASGSAQTLSLPFVR